MLYFFTNINVDSFEKGGAHAPVAPPLATALVYNALENLYLNTDDPPIVVFV